MRRLRPRVLECLRLGTAIVFLLRESSRGLEPVRRALGPAVRRVLGPSLFSPAAVAWSLVEVRATRRAQAPALLATARSDGKLDQQRFARGPAQVQPAAVVKPHGVVVLELSLEPQGSTRPVGVQGQIALDGLLERHETASAFQLGHGSDLAAYCHPLAGPFYCQGPEDRPGPLGLLELQIGSQGPFLKAVEPPGQGR